MPADFDNLGPDPYERWHYWLRRKRFQIWIRTRLSAYLAVGLAALVLIRERHDLQQAAQFLSIYQWILCLSLLVTFIVAFRLRSISVIRRGAGVGDWLIFFVVLAAAVLLSFREGRGLLVRIGQASGSDRLEWLVLVIATGTLCGALWEILGDKLSTSQRDRLFAIHVRELLASLDTFYSIPRGDGGASVRKLLREFTAEVIEMMCLTLCGRTHVSGAYMAPDGDSLKISIVSREAMYDSRLVIPLPADNPGPGPAAYAYKQKTSTGHCVYLPHKGLKEAWLMQLSRDRAPFAFNPPVQVGWVPARDPSLENFNSVLCVPVRFYIGTNREVNAGVLTVSTKRRDRFLPRDFIIAECFARILGQAMAIANRLERE